MNNILFSLSLVASSKQGAVETRQVIQKISRFGVFPLFVSFQANLQFAVPALRGGRCPAGKGAPAVWTWEDRQASGTHELAEDCGMIHSDLTIANSPCGG